MYYLIQHAPIRWPEKAKHDIEVSPNARDLISKVRKVNWVWEYYASMISVVFFRCWTKTVDSALVRTTTWTKYWCILSLPIWTCKNCFRNRFQHLSCLPSRTIVTWGTLTKKWLGKAWLSQFCLRPAFKKSSSTTRLAHSTTSGLWLGLTRQNKMQVRRAGASPLLRLDQDNNNKGLVLAILLLLRRRRKSEHFSVCSLKNAKLGTGILSPSRIRRTNPQRLRGMAQRWVLILSEHHH